MNPRVRNLGQSPQAQLVMAPRTPRGHDIARILRTVEHTGAALVELLAAVPAPVPAVALRCPLGRSLIAVDPHAGHRIPFQSPQKAERARSDGAKADRTCLGSEATETIETDRVALNRTVALRASPGDVMLNWRTSGKTRPLHVNVGRAARGLPKKSPPPGKQSGGTEIQVVKRSVGRGRLPSRSSRPPTLHDFQTD